MMTEIHTPTGVLATRMQRGDVLDPNCPSRTVLKHLTSRWGVLVLLALGQETLRFSQLRRKVGGVSEKMLAQTLGLLEEDGLVVRRSLPVVPPHVEYRLSEPGREVSLKVAALTDWIEDHLLSILLARALHKPQAGAD